MEGCHSSFVQTSLIAIQILRRNFHHPDSSEHARCMLEVLKKNRAAIRLHIWVVCTTFGRENRGDRKFQWRPQSIPRDWYSHITWHGKYKLCGRAQVDHRFKKQHLHSFPRIDLNSLNMWNLLNDIRTGQTDHRSRLVYRSVLWLLTCKIQIEGKTLMTLCDMITSALLG